MQKTTRERKNTRKTANYNMNNIAKLSINNKLDMPLVIVVLMLVALGIVMVLSASAPSALSAHNNSYYYVRTQVIAAVMGLIAMMILSKIDYKIYKKMYKLIYVGSVLILFTVLIPKLGVESNGARRWINIGLQVQPSEISKIGLIIAYAGYYSDRNNKIDTLWGGCIIPLIGLLIPVAILYKVQNHLSAGIVIAFVTIVTMIMGGCKIKYLAGTGVTVGSIGIAVLSLWKNKLSTEGSFRSDRIEAWLHPWENTSGTAYQTVQGLYAIGSGGFFGVGLGESKQKYLYIPEAHNDFIFAILAEELGFVGCLIVLMLFTVFVIRGVRISMKAEDMFGSLVAIGITALIAVQAVLNIAVVTNTIPNTGISLPFLSYGGTSLIILLCSVGVLLSISRSAKKL